MKLKQLLPKVLPIVTSTLLGVSMLGSASVPVFADDRTVPVYLTQEATPIDVTIGTGAEPIDPTAPEFRPQDYPGYDSAHPENVYPIDVDGDGNPDFYGPASNAIYMRALSDSNSADVTDLVVKNNNNSVPVYVKGILINNMQDGYSIQPYNSDFSSFQADSKKIGLAITGGTAALTPANPHDLANSYTSEGDLVAAGATSTYTLEGKTAISTSAISLKQIANCVVTVSMTQN